ncbi:MAG TPA: substrate-binding domain-containing protein [Symbiobacteriaceae bacterium]
MQPWKRMKWLQVVGAALLVLAMAGCGNAKPENSRVILATTTSTRDTGLLDYLIPIFEEKTGYSVDYVAVGTGQALAMGQRGEADVLLVHSPADEKKLVEDGTADSRRLVMHNDFIIVGPPDDPAGIKGSKKAAEAFQKIADAGALFISRGDESGTHKKELAIWKQIGLEPAGQTWYQETGSGMADTLNVAAEKGGYCLTDRGTYLYRKDTLGLDIMVEGDPILLNIYHVMTINPKKFDKVNAEGAKAFADFLLAEETQKLIAEYGVDKYGQPLFFADGGKTEEELMNQQ